MADNNKKDENLAELENLPLGELKERIEEEQKRRRIQYTLFSTTAQENLSFRPIEKNGKYSYTQYYMCLKKIISG